LNSFNSMSPQKAVKATKAEETKLRILDAALALFREEGFDAATMREIAAKAQVATGAAYYYYPSKEALVLAFYQRSCAEMEPLIAAALEGVDGLKERLRALIGVKFSYFAPNRGVLRALLRNGADPSHPLSPFSPETREIRDADMVWFERILEDCGTKIPRDLAPRLPGLLWFFQMGVIFFWVVDESPDQERSRRLLDLASATVATLIQLSALPFMRPVRKTALQLVEIATEGR